MKRMHYSSERGEINGAVVSMVLLGVVALGLGGLSIWLYLQYSEQKTDVDGKIKLAVAQAEKAQADKDEAKFAEREKEPNRQFIGPDDYGRLTFSYPKTWSVYVANEASRGGNYEAYLNPVLVPPVSGSEQRFALRVKIENQDIDRVLETYNSQVKTGKLKSAVFNASGQAGTRYDGAFNNDIRGAVVVFKVRDKTVSIFTDANTFKPDFENIIKTIKFNQ